MYTSFASQSCVAVLASWVLARLKAVNALVVEEYYVTEEVWSKDSLERREVLLDAVQDLGSIVVTTDSWSARYWPKGMLHRTETTLQEVSTLT